MEQIVRVKKVHEDGTVRAVLVRQSACSGDCHKCSGCGAATQTMELLVNDPIGVEVGDLVTITGSTGPVLGAAAMLYMLPLALFYIGYYIGAVLRHGALGGGLGFLVGIGAAVVYDRTVARKREVVYTITGYAGTREEG
ncbi:MAG: SoxR reducing system RseC family protein [Oscillospiraceae bacterium]|jgi:sigma-E factor negative regulatory protein RseC|nr:SoxR reducing system RseC family protein [Oscillospiraceae bacterium]MBQ5712212.1 SoxR reducing system RseC family protein [Oscillospiraceae bacterium]